MTRFVTAAASAVALLSAVSAQAAEQCFDKATLKYVDCPQPAAPVAVAPVVEPEVLLWAGPYVGAQVGYGWGSLDGDVSVPVIALTDTVEGDLDGVFAGLHAGYNWQFDRLVVGPELQANWSDLNGSEDNLGGFAGANGEGELEWFGSLSLRAGYEVAPAWLVFAKGGYSVGSVDLAVDSFTYSADEVLHGFNLGAGIEHQLFDHFRVGVEYGYTHFLDGDFDGTALGVAPVLVDSALDVHTLAVRASYGF